MKEHALNDWMSAYVFWFNERNWRQPPDWRPGLPKAKFGVPHIKRFPDDVSECRKIIEFYWRGYRNICFWTKEAA